MGQKTGSELLERIPAQDWEATPASVRTLLLSLLPLAAEAAELRARLETGEPANGNDPEADEEEPERRRVERYQALVDRLFLNGLSDEEQQQMERLGAEMDAHNSPFYAAALRRMEATAADGNRRE
jgi:hypothetical protein